MEQQRTDLQQQRLATRIESVYNYAHRRPGEVHEVVSLSRSDFYSRAGSSRSTLRQHGSRSTLRHAGAERCASMGTPADRQHASPLRYEMLIILDLLSLSKSKTINEAKSKLVGANRVAGGA